MAASAAEAAAEAERKGESATGAAAAAAADAAAESDGSEGEGGAPSGMTQSARLCNRPGCGKVAELKCPDCAGLGIPAHLSFFCEQECFRAAWAEHRKMHKTARKLLAASDLPAHFRGFTFSGKLRPWRVSPSRVVPDGIARPDYATHPAGRSFSEEAARPRMRRLAVAPVYTAEEIADVRAACAIGREALDAAGRAIRPGVLTDEIDLIVHDVITSRGAYPSPLNYYGFPKSVCTSINEVICHGIPDARPLLDGDIVNVDVTAYYRGAHGDLNETFLVGAVDDAGRALVQRTYECLEKAIEICKPGTPYREIGNVISRHAHSAKLSVVTAYCGHGIGRLFHTAPDVPHYAKNKAPGVMKPGNIFTIEPMICEGTYHEILWPDNWTAATRDGSRSAQFEHTLLITEDGCEVLTRRSKGSHLEP